MEDFTKYIIKLIELTGSVEAAKQTAIQIFNDCEEEIPDEFKRIYLQNLNFNELMIQMIPLYKKYYTHSEIIQLNAFYQSPIGKKSIQIMPILLQEGMIIVKKWGEAAAEVAIQKTFEELQSLGYDL